MRLPSTPFLRRALALAGLSLSLTACGGAPVFLRSVSCLRGPVPHVGRKVPDEMFALMRRERDRAAAASPYVRARILESIPDLFPDVSDLLPEPPCHDELEREGVLAFETAPLVFDRETVARIRSVHDAPPLIALSLRDEATIPDYHLGPDEPGPAPARSFLRYRALANIPTYWIADNRKDGRALLLDRLRSSTDATEQLLLQGAASAIFDQALWGHPDRAEGVDGPSLLGAFIGDVAKRLQDPPDRAALELVLLRVGDIGRFGVRFGHESAARGVVHTILRARGDLPLTRGNPAAQKDLLEVAFGALFDLDTPQKHVGVSALPPPRRERFDPRKDWLDREPAGGRPSDADRAARVRDLDQELTTLKYNAPRCYVLAQLGEWLSDAEAAARFDAFVAPAFEGEREVDGDGDRTGKGKAAGPGIDASPRSAQRVALNTESLCRLRVALHMQGVPAEKRAALVARMLNTPLPARAARDLSKDEQGPAIGYPADEDPVRQIAALVLAEHLSWIDVSPDIRRFLMDRAMEPIPREHPPAETWSLLGPAFERAVQFHLSGAPGTGPEIAAAAGGQSPDGARAAAAGGRSPDAAAAAGGRSPDAARAALRAWMASVRAALADKPASHIYVGEVVQRRIRALGDLAGPAGLAAEATALFTELSSRRDAVIARQMLDVHG